VAVVGGLEALHVPHQQEARAEDPCLLVGAGRELAAGDAALEAEVVANPGARARLAADRLPLDHERAEPLGGGIHRRRQAGGTGADDRDVERAGVLPEPGAHPVALLREILVGRVDEDAVVGEEHDRLAGLGAPARGEEPPPLLGVAGLERVRNAVSGEQVSQLEAARGEAVGDDGQLAPALGAAAPPLVQELADRPVEQLVGLAPGLQDVVVDMAAGHGLPDHDGRLLVPPGAEVDQEAALGLRVQLAHALEQLLAADALRAAGGQDDGHAAARPTHRLELAERILDRPSADDPVVALVSVELVSDPFDRVRVRIDRDDRRPLVPHGFRGFHPQ
jgi:hypothetical protein